MKEDGSQCVIISNTDEQSVAVAAIVVPIVLAAGVGVGVAVFLYIRQREKPDKKKCIDDQLDDPMGGQKHDFDSQDQNQDQSTPSSESYYMVCCKSLLMKFN